jgi:DnaJ-class molecular chaperone
MGMNQQQLDDRITAFKRLRAEQLHNEQQRTREYRQATTSSTDHLQQKALTVLGLTTESSPEEIKKAYRTLVKQFHPDRFQHVTRSEQKQMELQFIRIQEAYEYLTQ